MNHNQKKSELLGMNYGTARARLDRDLLFKFAVEAGHVCYRCNEPLVRESFTVDHREHWSVAENPKEKYFDLENIAFSHYECNSGETSNKKYFTEEEKQAAKLASNRKYYCSLNKEERRSYKHGVKY